MVQREDVLALASLCIIVNYTFKNALSMVNLRKEECDKIWET